MEGRRALIAPNEHSRCLTMNPFGLAETTAGVRAAQPYEAPDRYLVVT